MTNESVDHLWKVNNSSSIVFLLSSVDTGKKLLLLLDDEFVYETESFTNFHHSLVSTNHWNRNVTDSKEIVLLTYSTDTFQFHKVKERNDRRIQSLLIEYSLFIQKRIDAHNYYLSEQVQSSTESTKAKVSKNQPVILNRSSKKQQNIGIEFGDDDDDDDE
ncbi:hypothetical protein SNEBB_001351 [Seison nebaliae]|nr:hypothetical protein SNEBB_001351 [Seison nebaliae]